jgi:hypothetical protein
MLLTTSPGEYMMAHQQSVHTTPMLLSCAMQLQRRTSSTVLDRELCRFEYLTCRGSASLLKSYQS